MSARPRPDDGRRADPAPLSRHEAGYSFAGVNPTQGTNFEQSLLRYIAATLGVSYEQLSRDYTNTNYSSARAAMTETWKFMQARKKLIADRFATIDFPAVARGSHQQQQAVQLPEEARLACSTATASSTRVRRLSPAASGLAHRAARSTSSRKRRRRSPASKRACRPARTSSPASARTGARCSASSSARKRARRPQPCFHLKDSIKRQR
jgi:hypothetical protein